MNKKTFTVTFTENEAAVLLNLLDGSVRHFGRQAAASVAHLEQKILAAQKATPELNTIKTGE